jgi:hypothetical protein
MAYDMLIAIRIRLLSTSLLAIDSKKCLIVALGHITHTQAKAFACCDGWIVTRILMIRQKKSMLPLLALHFNTLLQAAA